METIGAMRFKRWTFGLCLPALAATVLGLSGLSAQSVTLALPEARKEGGLPLMEALAARHSTREYSGREIPLQVLSDLLWAADGVNRSESGGRTAPSAHDRREIDLYVITPEAYYLYLPTDHSLRFLGKTDLRKLAGTQDYVATAPLNLIYVADFARVPDTTDEERVFYGAAATGFIAQNVYLFCASAGLGTVVRASIDEQELGDALKLRPEQKIMLAQSVGYPPDN
jgi:nitroreductase